MSSLQPSKATPSQKSPPTARLATANDWQWIEDLQAIAFGPGRYARTAFRVRERFPIDPSLSMIAEIDGAPVSSVALTPISVGETSGYLLGPLATIPEFRNRGAAKLLVRESVARAMERPGVRFVLLVGDEPYYGPLGFQRVQSGIVFPGPVDPRRVLVHCPDADLVPKLQGRIGASKA